MSLQQDNSYQQVRLAVQATVTRLQGTIKPAPGVNPFGESQQEVGWLPGCSLAEVMGRPYPALPDNVSHTCTSSKYLFGFQVGLAVAIMAFGGTPLDRSSRFKGQATAACTTPGMSRFRSWRK